ncbi:class IIb bacteriocin, lactobin A/cerein 7B family [Flavobacterium sp. KACC 22761]|nr:class IIb bacteriocin, lactobin A/cerein 7B family [Flavobacterium sp. KACC 22761]WPO80236.1 class IIb bacteriocin, lactobin A/cerein 7B family [Flavobacterium sp. KACC 22761]
MNLEKMNLVELNAQEVEEIEGGFLLEILAGIIIGALAYLLTT